MKFSVAFRGLIPAGLIFLSACQKNISEKTLPAHAGSELSFTPAVQGCHPLGYTQYGSTAIPRKRTQMAATGTGTKVMFAFGYNTDNSAARRADILDLSTGVWDTKLFSSGAYAPAAGACDGKMAVTGVGDTVHLYDVNSDHWSNAHLSIARFYAACAGSGSKILFAGGQSSDLAYSRVDIYNAAADSWSTAELSLARTNAAAASARGKILFAGGVLGPNEVRSNRVDIYDVATGSWSIASLSVARNEICAVTRDNLIFFAGGSIVGTSYRTVDIYDAISGSWTSTAMAHGNNGYYIGFTLGTKVGFIGHGASVADVYDICSKTWSTMSVPANYLSSAFTLSNKMAMTDPGGTVHLYQGETYN